MLNLPPFTTDQPLERMLRASGQCARSRGLLHRSRKAWSTYGTFGSRSCPVGRQYATVTELRNYPQLGEQLHGFRFKRTRHVPELQLTAFYLEHERTGAEYLHVARDDKNNVFSVGFKTNPPDDTGVPHILEHTTLCGSEKYTTTLLMAI